MNDSKNLMKQQELIKKLSMQLQEIIDCPYDVDSATCPKGIDNYPATQVVLEYSISYARILKAKELLHEVSFLNNG